MTTETKKLTLDFITEHSKKYPLVVEKIYGPILKDPTTSTKKFYNQLMLNSKGLSKKFNSLPNIEVQYWFASRVKHLANMFRELDSMLKSNNIDEIVSIMNVSDIQSSLDILHDFADNYQ